MEQDGKKSEIIALVPSRGNGKSLGQLVRSIEAIDSGKNVSFGDPMSIMDQIRLESMDSMSIKDRLNTPIMTASEFAERFYYPRTVTQAFNFVGSFSELPKEGHAGNMVIIGDETYIFNGIDWDPIASATVEPNYVLPQMKHPSICPRCGAPMHSCTCEYCDCESYVC